MYNDPIFTGIMEREAGDAELTHREAKATSGVCLFDTSR